MSKQQLIREIYTTLQYHKSLGIAHYPDTEGLNELLNHSFEPQTVATSSVAPSQNVGQATVQAETVVPSLEQASLKKSVPPPPPTLAQESDQEICGTCGLRSKRIGFVEGKGGDTIRLLMVGDWLAGAEQTDTVSVFGAEQDLMLARMFAAMKLPESDVFVTNIVKCALPADVRPEINQISSCVKLLNHQIATLQPQIICTMGSVASQTLLNKSHSLSQLRGKFYQVEFAEGLVIPVLATYHPTYLLKNAEMKRPAWEDLQKVVQRLSGKKKGIISG